ncbi:MAG: hypothetical protein ACMUHX_04165 [bacterium]
MCNNRNLFNILFVLLIAGFLVLGIQCPRVEAQTTTTTTTPTFSYLPFMGMGMMGMGGMFPWQYSNLGSLDLSSLGYSPFMGMMGMGRFNPYLYSSLGSGLDTSSLGLGYPYMGGMMGMMGMGMMPYLYNSLLGTTTTTPTPTTI